jgi:hypothetical protein
MASLSMHITKNRPSTSGFLRSVILALAISFAGCSLIWALDLASSAYFVVALMGAIGGGAVFAVRMIAEAPVEGPIRFRVPQTLKILAKRVAGMPTSPTLLIALTGPSRSGKTEIAAAIAARHTDWARASFGDFVRAEARRRGMRSDDRWVTDQLGNELVKELGAKVFVKKALKEAGVSPTAAPRLLIDDVYHEEVMRALKEGWKSAISVKVNRIGSAGQAPQIKRSPLDEEADKLVHDLPPEIEIDGATQEDASKRGEELLKKVDLRLGVAT